MNGDARVPGAKPSEHGSEQPGDKGFIASDLDLAERRIAGKLDIPHPLTQIIKNCRCLSGAARDHG